MPFQSALELSKQLITIESTADNPHGLEQALDVSLAKLHNFTIEYFEDFGVKSALVYNTAKRPKEFRLIIGGHLDVVPGKPFQFVPVEKNGRLYGRGSYDMKPAMAVLIELFSLQATKVNYPLALQLVTDEEQGGHHGVRHQLAQGVRSQFTVLGEYSDGLINNQAKGICWLRLKTNSVSAHGAYPWRSTNATSLMVQALNDLQRAHPRPTKETDKTTWNISWFDVPDKTKNRSSASAEAFIDVRFNSGDKTFTSLNPQIITSYVQSLTDVELAIDVITLETACHTKSTNPDVQNLKKHTGATFLSTHGTSDIRFFESHGMPGVCFGPKGANPHAKDEYVEIDSLKKYYDWMRAYIKNIG